MWDSWRRERAERAPQQSPLELGREGAVGGFQQDWECRDVTISRLVPCCTYGQGDEYSQRFGEKMVPRPATDHNDFIHIRGTSASPLAYETLWWAESQRTTLWSQELHTLY
jgi:hypothetical protein